ncbi:centrosomal protein of 112 kDa-like isoform X1 [Oncorhynchus kisutch]|uniref:centrosomal protein of 112 kDa-like isoform X1 n=1 Tax=Oncorhynchus kisutch TaxID=8019 RepID=UPI0012DC175C|nr:centrosomal protein of 112 kDa-like isoform X1 [Oncorhynchus kisutch]
MFVCLHNPSLSPSLFLSLYLFFSLSSSSASFRYVTCLKTDLAWPSCPPPNPPLSQNQNPEMKSGRSHETMCEQRAGQEQERMRLQQHYSTERDNLVQQRQREVGTMEREARAALHQHQHQTQEWRQHDAQVISNLEEQVSSLRDELQQAHSQRKQQLLELGVLREEERQRAAQDQEASLGRLRAEMDHICLELETSHKAERQLAQEKVGEGVGVGT